MGAAQSQQQQQQGGRSKQQELADFLSRSDASTCTFSDAESDASSPHEGDAAQSAGGALIMLPSALDSRGRTIRRIERGSHGERPQVTVDDFEYLKVIGVGAMARVLLVRWRHDGELYAIKVTSKRCVRANRLESSVVSERDVLGGTDHPSLDSQQNNKLQSTLNDCRLLVEMTVK